MTHTIKNISLVLSLLLVSPLSTSSMAHNGQESKTVDRTDQDVDNVFGGIKIREGEKVKNVSGVNGSIRFADNSHARNVETVNGGIKLGEQVSVRLIETVNGGIKAGQNLSVEKSIETVNGGIKLSKGSVVGKNIKSVNGGIHLDNVIVKQNVKNTNGDIKLLNGSVIEGNLILAKSDSWFSSRTDDKADTLVKIDATSKVLGEVHLYRAVKLEISAEAKIGKVVKYYTEK